MANLYLPPPSLHQLAESNNYLAKRIKGLSVLVEFWPSIFWSFSIFILSVIIVAVNILAHHYVVQVFTAGMASILLVLNNGHRIGLVLMGVLLPALSVVGLLSGYQMIDYFIASGCLVSIPALFLYRRNYWDLYLNAQYAFDGGIYITPDTHPEECVRFFEWCNKNGVIRNYYLQVKKLNRSITLEEYNAAEQLVGEMGTPDNGVHLALRSQARKERQHLDAGFREPRDVN